MARADLILSIVEAARNGDDAALRRTVEALIAEEREKQHHVLAERLEEALRSNGSPAPAASEVGRTPSPVETITPRRQLEELFLPEFVRTTCAEVVEEQRRVEVLRSYGLEPRHRILLTGPPGNGKTSLAEGVAEALLVPLLRVRYEAVVGSFLGETAAQLSRVFAFARTRHAVLFFDEFDAIAKERGDEHETGEIKRVVSSLLMQIDDLPSHVVVIAASNHAELLDRAVGRRFEVHLELPRPDVRARTEWFARFLGSVEGRVSRSPATLAKATAGASFSSLEDLTLDIKRRQTLNPDIPLNKLITERLERWKQDRRGANVS